MNKRILDLARYTSSMLRNIDSESCKDDIKKVNDANDDLEKAVDKIKGLNWDALFAIDDDKRQELTIHQQKIIDCYAKLKRVLLEVYHDLFHVIKGL